MKLPINQIICGNCLEVMKDWPDGCVDLVLTDPPYLTTKEVWDKKEVVSEELSRELFRIAKPSCSLYCWCGIGEKSQSLIRWFPTFSKLWKFKDLITWKKQRGIGMQKGWLYTREEIMWFVKDNKQFAWNKKFQYGDELNQFKVGMKGTKVHPYKRISDVWIDIPEKLTRNTKVHFTPKPLKAIERIILVHTKENDVIFDCFAGSGTTCVAAKMLGRRYIGIDISPEYCQITRERLKGVRPSLFEKPKKKIPEQTLGIKTKKDV